MRLDAVSFLKYLDMVLAEAQAPDGKRKEHPSPWLLLDAADTLFETARRRVYTGRLPTGRENANGQGQSRTDTLQPVLEELPKWETLSDILAEIEQDAYFNPVTQDDSSGAILIMCADLSIGAQIREYLETMHVKPEAKTEEGDDSEPTSSASFMMRRKLRNYIHWKQHFNKVATAMDEEIQKSGAVPTNARGGQNSRGRAPPNKRRRVRGASAAASGPNRNEFGGPGAGDRDAHMASLLSELGITDVEAQQKEEITADPLEKMEDFYQLFDLQDMVVVHPYDGDMDEHVLEEVKPRYIVMFEPDAAFIRRIEVYRSSHTDRNVKVYFMYYGGSIEEQRYLAAVRKEKDAFTKLIRERGVSCLRLPLSLSLC
jgi:DNA excision repair protein ERCC-4